MSVGADTPTVSTLGNKFSASSNKLNAEFALEYGESIFSFLTNYRLETSRHEQSLYTPLIQGIVSWSITHYALCLFL